MIISFARPGPMRRGNSWVAPVSGTSANPTSGRPNFAVVSQMRMSAASAVSIPPPITPPFNAAITTFGLSTVSWRIIWWRRTNE